MDPQGSTEGILGVYDLYMNEMKAKYGNAKLRVVLV